MFKTLGMLASCQVLAPLMVIDIPSFFPLKVVEISHEDGEWMEPYDYNEEDWVDDLGDPKWNPSRTVISIWSRQTARVDIVINEHTGEFITYNWDHIGNKLSSKIVPMVDSFKTLIYGLPSLLGTSPALITNELLWKSLETMTGMDRHAWSVWIRIKNQLDPKSYILAEKAFSKYKR